MRKFLIGFAAAIIIFGQGTIQAMEVKKISLEESIRMGIENSPLSRIYDDDLKKAAGKLKQAAAELLPSVRLNGSVSKSFNMEDPAYMGQLINEIIAAINEPDLIPLIPGAPAKKDITSYMAAINISQVLYSPPAFKSYTIAKLFYGQERLNWQKHREELVLNIVNTYLTALKARHSYQLALENANQAEKNLAMTKARYNVGLVTKADVLRMEVNVASAKNTLSRAEIGVKSSLLAFKNLLGLPLDEPIELADVDLPKIETLPEPEEMLEKALKSRSDYLMGEIAIKLSEISLSIAKSAYWPNLVFNASYGQGPVGRLDFNNNKWSLGVSFTMNIWDSGKTGGAVKEATAALNQAKLVQDMNKKAIEMELIQTYLNQTEIQQRLALNEKAVEQAAESLRLAERSYAEGLITAMELDGARIGLETAKLNHLQAKFDLIAYNYNMRKARGILEINQEVMP